MKIPFQKLSTRAIYLAFLHLAVVVLGVEVFLLAKQNRDLRSMTEPPQAVRAGDSFPIGSLRLVSGIAALDTTRPMLLFLFSTKCGVCEKSLAGWKHIFGELGSERVQIAGIALDSVHLVKQFVTLHGLGYPVFVPETPVSFAAGSSVRFVPQTVWRLGNGLVESSWPGMMTDSLSSVVLLAARAHNRPPT